MSTSARSTSPDSPARWRRLISAQQSGLLLVIALMMIALTLATPQITRRERTQVPASARIERSAAGFTVTLNGSTRSYRTAGGDELSENPDGSYTLERRSIVNRFLNAQNLVGIAKDASFIGIMAVGMTGIIIMGGIDLSIGSIYALAGILGGLALHAARASGHDSPPLAVAIGILIPSAVGAACGALNGAATVGLRVHPFIITLGGMAIYRGLAFVISRGQSIGEFPRAFTDGLFRAGPLGVQAVPVLLMLIVTAAGGVLLASTVLGRRSFAIGGNETAARYAGVPVGRTKVIIYALAGLTAGLAAAAMLGYYGAVSSAAGTGYELDVIAAAVVGGASLSGGRGSALGAMLGAIVIQLINNAITVLQVDENYKQIIIGLAVILAVVADQTRRRLSARPG